MQFLRILATTDFHGSAEAFRKTALKARESHADLIVVCGDITHFGLSQQARELLSLLNTSPTLFVPGNCDPPTLAEEALQKAESIHGKCRQFNGVNFLGVGGSPPSPFHTPFELAETEIANILEHAHNACQTQSSTTVIVSHAPPRNTNVDLAFTNEHVGSISVREFVEKTSPRLVLCGHIHEATGMDTINNTMIVNPGPAGHGKCVLVDLNRTISIKPDQL